MNCCWHVTEVYVGFIADLLIKLSGRALYNKLDGHHITREIKESRLYIIVGLSEWGLSPLLEPLFKLINVFSFYWRRKLAYPVKKDVIHLDNYTLLLVLSYNIYLHSPIINKPK